MEDSQGRIWAGTVSSGVVVIAPQSMRVIKRYSNDAAGAEKILSDKVHHLLELRDGSVLISNRRTDSGEGGISLVGRDGDVILNLKAATVWYSAYAGGRILLATEEGLMEFQPESAEIVSINEFNKLLGDNRRVWSLYAKDEQTVYAGTMQGVFRFPLSGGETRHWSTRNGLANNVVYSVFRDNAGSLWITTNRGITRISPSSDQIYNFRMTHGLQDMEFNLNSFCFTSEEELIFGGISGYNIFRPEDIEISTETADAFIGEIRLFNIPITPETEYNGRVIIESTVETLG